MMFKSVTDLFFILANPRLAEEFACELFVTSQKQLFFLDAQELQYAEDSCAHSGDSSDSRKPFPGYM